MMKNYLKWVSLQAMIFLLLSVTVVGWSQSQKIVFENHQEKHSAFVVSEKSDEIVLTFQLHELYLTEVQTDYGVAHLVHSPKAPNVLEQGYPDLFYLARSIIIPDMGGMKVEVKAGNYHDYFNIEVAPSKGNLTRNINPNDVPYVKGKIYEVDDFYPSQLASLRDPHIIRDFRGQAVEVYPVQYNPVTKTLRVYEEITVTISSNGRSGVNEFIRNRILSGVDREFAQIYSDLFMNYRSDKYPILEEEGDLLIVCFDDFMTAMQPFVNWKNKIGRKTTIVPKSQAGTTSAAIKTYITNFYNNPSNNLTHVLLIGDAAQIPTNSLSTGHSDGAYGYITGNDSYNELFVGRFSAENVAHVQTQVQRMIEYERDLNTTDTWVNSGMGIARNEGTGQGHNGENDYVHMDLIRDTLLNFTYNTVYREYDGNVPGVTNTTAALISSRINNGVSIINFCNHGSETSWSVANYSVTQVNQLTNIGRLPFIWSVACVNGAFVNTTCFAEAWLRATHDNQPTGAIGTMMSTINQAWQPPQTGQDHMVGILAEGFPNNIKRTFGGTSINGSMKMLDVHGTSGIETHNTWVLFGDPTLMVRTDVPQQMTISHNPTLFLGSSSFTVNCDADNAMVAISYEDNNGVVQLLASAIVQDGVAVVEFADPIVEPLDLTVAITAFNKVTYIGSISAVPADEPYVVLKAFSTSIAPDFGQTLGINVILENISELPYIANGVSAQISSDSPYINIIDNSVSAGTIQPGQEVALSSAFTVSIANDVPNQTTIPFGITISGEYDGTVYEWNQSFSFKANAPVLAIGNLSIDDDGQGIPNFLEPGETAQLILTVTNSGNAGATGVVVTISAQSPFFNLLTSSATVDVDAQASVQVAFDVEANAATPDGLGLDIVYTANMGSYDASGATGIHIGPLPETTVGSGTEDQQSSAYYPLDNYYKANRSQSLYFASEVSPAPQTITQLGFYMKSIGTVNPYVNLTIKLMETSITEIPTSFVNTTTATTVFTAATYTMPSSVGWLVFDIEDFEYSGQSNLLVEVSFGINASWTSTRYTVNCTTTPVNTVAYGYSDTQALPSYTNRTTKRPNLFLAFEAELSDLYPVTVTVHDQFGDAMPEALVMIGSLPLALDDSGSHALELPNGSYPWMASQAGYVPETGQLEVADGAATLPIVLNLMINDDAEILAFGFTEVAVDAVTISPVVEHAGTVDVLVPYGTSLTTLTPEITVSYGATLTPAGGVPTDFSAPVVYTVTAESGNVTNTYTVTVGHSAELFTLTLVADPAEGGEVSGGGDYAEGVEVTVEATPSYGYLFVGWYDAEGEALSADATYAYTMPGEDVELTARFEVITYTLTLVSHPEDAGVLSGAGAYAEGAEVAVAAEAAYGYAFAAWTDAAGDTLAVEAIFTYVMPAEDMELTARFEALPTYALTLSSSPAGAGTLEGAGSYLEGEAVEVAATPAAGYLFVSWKHGEVEVSDEAGFTYVMPAEDVELTAHFEALPTYALTLVASPAEAGTLIGAGSYLEGEAVEVAATPAAGYLFVSWKHGEVEVSGDASFTYVMPAEAVELTAYFEAEVPTYTVTFVVTCTQSGALEGAEVALNGGTPVATNADGEAVFTGLEANTYTYTVTKGTHHAVAGEVVVDQNLTMPVSIVPLGAELNLLHGLSVYPNPFSGTLNITNSKNVERVIIANVLGQVMIDINLNGKSSIETTDLGLGLYVVTLQAKNGETRVIKLIKQ